MQIDTKDIQDTSKIYVIVKHSVPPKHGRNDSVLTCTAWRPCCASVSSWMVMARQSCTASCRYTKVWPMWRPMLHSLQMGIEHVSQKNRNTWPTRRRRREALGLVSKWTISNRWDHFKSRQTTLNFMLKLKCQTNFKKSEKSFHCFVFKQRGFFLFFWVGVDCSCWLTADGWMTHRGGAKDCIQLRTILSLPHATQEHKCN